LKNGNALPLPETKSTETGKATTNLKPREKATAFFSLEAAGGDFGKRE